MSPPKARRFADPAFWVAAAGLLLTLATFWPGYLSWDSAYQWAQARGSLPLDPAHPPVMVRTWVAARALLPDPGGMFALQAALWWGAVALLASALGGSPARRATLVLLVGAWPPLLALLPHLWKDVWCTALLALAVACLAAERRAAAARAGARAPGRRVAWLLAALAAIAAGVAFRANAITAALPLLAWIGAGLATAWGSGRSPAAGTGARRRERRRQRLRAALATAAALAVVAGAGALLNRSDERPVPLWPAIALWDLAAVSIDEDRLLFPPDWIDPSLTVDELRRDFDPAVNVPVFASGKLWLNFYFDYTPEQFAALRDAWLALPREHPRAWLAHRARLSAFLFGLRQDAHPDGLVLSPGITAFVDNPPVARNDGPLHRRLQPALARLVDTPLFAGWLYLALAAVLVLRWLWRRDGGFAALSAVVALSSLTLAAPLVFAAPSSDFRYLMWSVAAAVMAAALASAGRASFERGTR